MPVTSASDFAAVEAVARRNGLLIGIALLILIGTTLAALVWRRRRREAEQLTGDGMSLARGISQTIARQMSAPLGGMMDDDEDVEEDAVQKTAPPPEPSPEPTPTAAPAPTPTPAPAPAPAPTPSPPPIVPPAQSTAKPAAPANPAREEPARAPARLDLGLEIASATRSLMMFSVDFRLDIANRSDFAVRDLIVRAQLACAQRGAGDAAPTSASVPIDTIGRIGPNQSHRTTGQLQLPLGEVKAIQQGTKPLFIPLLHVTLEGGGQPTITRSFVIGSPSATSQGRVHPLPLDGPPGGLPGLRAQLIKQPLGGDTKAAEPA